VQKEVTQDEIKNMSGTKLPCFMSRLKIRKMLSSRRSAPLSKLRPGKEEEAQPTGYQSKLTAGDKLKK